MKLSIGIVGLPNVGKSTLFKLLTKNEVHIANYPFATIDPNIGVVPVPDTRLAKLAQISKSVKTIPAVVEFCDIAGLVKNAHKGEGLGNQFLSHIREASAIVIVLRLFENPDIVHVEGDTDPVRDLEIIEHELALKDLEVLENRLRKAESDVRSGKKETLALKNNLLKIREKIYRGIPVFTGSSLSQDEKSSVADLNLLTAKPQIFLLNGDKNLFSQKLKEKISEYGGSWVISDLSADVDLSPLISESYRILGLVSFFTSGEKETRAWTIVKGAKAPQAAGTIHTDFEKKFIRAEVVAYDKLVQAGGWSVAKQRGLLRLEGKEYEMRDGDVIVVRHG